MVGNKTNFELVGKKNQELSIFFCLLYTFLLRFLLASGFYESDNGVVYVCPVWIAHAECG